jgi:aspartyl aminopeptidase
MAHAVHPNFSNKYEDKHKPRLNEGVVIKVNGNGRYMTNSSGIVVLDQIAHRAGDVPLQKFVVRNDSSCGSTIGPMLAAKLGLRYVLFY